jgi:hypothetical protein
VGLTAGRLQATRPLPRSRDTVAELELRARRWAREQQSTSVPSLSPVKPASDEPNGVSPCPMS